MKILTSSDTPRPERSPAAGQPATPARPAASAGTSAAAGGAKVELSALAARLNQLETQFADADFDADKVEAIRTAIAEGRFEVKASAVADRLIDSVDEILGRKA